MPSYPLIISFADVVQVGSASVRVFGDLAVLAQLEDGLWTLSAVSAGGTDGTGPTLEAAYSDFRQDVRCAIEDSIESGAALPAFEYEIQCVFTTVDPMYERLWAEALDSLRSGKLRAAHGTERLQRRPARELQPVRVEKLPDATAIAEAMSLSLPLGRAA